MFRLIVPKLNGSFLCEYGEGLFAPQLELCPHYEKHPYHNILDRRQIHFPHHLDFAVLAFSCLQMVLLLFYAQNRQASHLLC